MAYRTSGDLLSDVRRLSREKERTVTADEIFYSPSFHRYAQTFITSLTNRYTDKISLRVSKDLNDCPTAYTNGDNVVINPHSDIVTYYTSLLNEFQALMGLVFHETAHILYLDFSSERTAMKTLESGYLYGDEPDTQTEDEARDLAEIKDGLAHNIGCRQILMSIYKTLSNIVADVHDETAMKRDHSAFVARCIATSAESLRESATPLEDMEENADGNELSILYALILQTIRYGEVVVRDNETLTTSPYMETINSLHDDLIQASEEDNFQNRMGHLNKVVLTMWPYIRDMIQPQDEQKNAPGEPGDGGDQSNDQNGSQGNGQGNSQTKSQCSGSGKNGGKSKKQEEEQDNDSSPSSSSNQPNSSTDNKSQNGSLSAKSDNPMSNLTKEQVEKILDALKQAMQNAGTGSCENPTGRFGQLVPDNTQPATPNMQDSTDDVQGDDRSEEILQSVIAQAAKDMAEQEVDKELTRQLQSQLKIADASSSHKGIPLEVEHPEANKTELEPSYNELLDSVKLYSKRMQKGVLQVLKDMREGYTLHHRQYGPILEASEAYRVDNRYFANKKLPQDVPDMVVAVLVDESGSMWAGNKIQVAQRAAVLLHDFCLGIEIPVHIAGHHTRGNKVVYTTYTDYNAVGSLDRYRLMRMSCGGSNRDGMAVQIAAEHLQARPEQIKLLIVISDGLPNHTNYGGSAAEKDIQEIVRKAKRQGIEVIGAAIDSDKDTIKRIYGDGFLDITNLETLPKTLINIVKKRVVPC